MLYQGDCCQILPQLIKNSFSLILTDPPYSISKSSFFAQGGGDEYRFGEMTHHFGQWDEQIFDWDFLMDEFYRILKPGGTLLLFYDVWKCQEIKRAAEKAKFKQPRIGQWVKTNPVPLNSKRNYLSNAVEYFFTFTKRKRPTFNGEYDRGIYHYPLCHGKERLDHPTQKPLKLIEDLIQKHSQPQDNILDPFAGTGTTGEGCQNLTRNFWGIEQDPTYFSWMEKRLNKEASI